MSWNISYVHANTEFKFCIAMQNLIPYATLILSQLLPNMMDIHIKTLKGHIYTLQMEPSQTIDDLKTKFSKSQGIPPDQQRLIYNSKVLENDQTLDSYEISNGCTIYLVLRLRS